MKSIELFEAARQAAIEIKQIKRKSLEMHERIGVQGQSYQINSMTGVLDPMRKVDDLLEWEIKSTNEIAECNRELDKCREIVAGINALGGKMQAQIISRYYLSALGWDRVAKNFKISAEEAEKTAKNTLAVVDKLGIAYVKEQGRAWMAK